MSSEGESGSMEIRRRGVLVVVSAPSGAGKSTLCAEVRTLVPKLFYSISCTTRFPRPGEVDGKDFHFVSEAEFVAMRDRDELAEWAQVHGNLYGTPAPPLEAALARGEDVLLDIDTQGARQLRKRYPEAVSVFIMAPSLAELAARLRERKSDAPGEIVRRLGRARQEIASWREYDYLIINRDVKEAVERLATIIQGERWRTSRLTIQFPDVEVPD
ncbi:MAG TPA: guanylate kinase [Candidatus Binatia bacterium]|nr:guanylate kinase [Candidatus Binatia bacterium]